MNRPLVTAVLFASVSLASVLATTAHAGSAQAAGAQEAADAATPLQAVAPSIVDERADAKPAVDRNCMQYTGSRIVARHNATRSANLRHDKAKPRCVAANGRVYSRDDIERTGEVDIADALRKLDPSIR